MSGKTVDFLMSLKLEDVCEVKCAFCLGGRGLFYEKFSQLVVLLSNYDVKDPTNLIYDKLKPHLFYSHLFSTEAMLNRVSQRNETIYCHMTCLMLDDVTERS